MRTSVVKFLGIWAPRVSKTFHFNSVLSEKELIQNFPTLIYILFFGSSFLFV